MGPTPNGWLGGLICLVAIFLPSPLLLVGVSPFWDSLRRQQAVQAGLNGINAAVVGLLLAALYNPVWTSAIHAPAPTSYDAFFHGLGHGLALPIGEGARPPQLGFVGRSSINKLPLSGAKSSTPTERAPRTTTGSVRARPDSPAR